MSATQAQAAKAETETRKHIARVGFYLHMMCRELLSRAEVHDASKLEDPETATFAEFTAKLAGCTYDSPEYKQFLAAMKPALDHHYGNNRHHPEHFPEGVKDMTLLDLAEMLCDWKAASERHHDGNIRQSIEKNTARFDIPPILAAILVNTVKEVFGA